MIDAYLFLILNNSGALINLKLIKINLIHKKITVKNENNNSIKHYKEKRKIRIPNMKRVSKSEKKNINWIGVKQRQEF